jgi:hypothetical protein
LYEGAYIHEFIDNTLSENKNYVYTITPIYNGKKGSSVSLPSVSTRKNEEAEIDDEILSKEWWKY